VSRFLALVLLLLALSAGAAQARINDQGGGGGHEVRVAAVCGPSTTASLRLRADDHRIELRFRLRQRSGRGVWRITVVHEQRVSSRATKRTTRSDDSFELRRRLADLRGTDTIVVHAWGPKGLGCRAAATLTE
jgi:hypothetical protein